MKRVNLQRVLPSLAKECSNANMVPFILPNMIEVAEQATNEEYCQKIFPEFIPLFKITEPIQVRALRCVPSCQKNKQKLPIFKQNDFTFGVEFGFTGLLSFNGYCQKCFITD